MEAALSALLDVFASRPQLVGEGLKDFVVRLACHEEFGHLGVFDFTLLDYIKWLLLGMCFIWLLFCLSLRLVHFGSLSMLIQVSLNHFFDVRLGQHS